MDFIKMNIYIYMYDIYIYFAYVISFVCCISWSNLACRLAMGVGAGNSTATHARQVGQLLESDVFKKYLVQKRLP